ncbi:MAG: malate dehydrogenase [Pelagibacteraceae bacterium TMED65]|nr:malate dehydrogenase [Rickettsiales bacterium]OUU52597.1 MAG: malate dehydrogenase [Pelagibacteraceae bacterium TMED65]|tara:strand:+ start:897 stop:1844 length:948 start_codon:yes stop_codon:yes gene_type:complete
MKKISLIGAGNIGTILAYNLSRKQIGQITMVDIVEGLAEGKCLDLAQSFPVENLNLKIEGFSDISKIQNSSAIIITAGIARKPGMSRDDLIETNFAIMKDIGEAIKQYSPNAFVICVTNPLDAMVWSLKNVSGIKHNMITGMAGILDSARFRFFLSQELRISVESIQTMVLGGHGDSMVPLLDYTSVSGIPLNNFIDENKIERQTIDNIVKRTRAGGGEIVALMKNSSAFYSPACSAIEMLESFLLDQRKILPCSAFLNGEYGYNDIFVGVPVIIGKNGVEEIIELNLSKESKKQFDDSVNSVNDLVKKCKKLLV